MKDTKSHPTIIRAPSRQNVVIAPEEPEEISCFSYAIYSLDVKMFKFVAVMLFTGIIAAGIIMMFLGAWLYNGWWAIFSFIFVAFAIIPDLMFNRIPAGRSFSYRPQLKVYFRDIAFIFSGFCYFSSFAIILVFAHAGVISVRAMAMQISSVFIIHTSISLFMKLYVHGEFQRTIQCFNDIANDDADIENDDGDGDDNPNFF